MSASLRQGGAAADRAEDFAADRPRRFTHDFSRIAVHSYRSEEPEEGPGPISELRDTEATADAGTIDADFDQNAGEAGEADQEETPAARGLACTIWTRTLASAPDGTSDRRRTVGVNEMVRMRCLRRVDWTATSGTITPDKRGFVAIWTAPATAGSVTVEGTLRRGAPCSVSMTVIAPEKNIQEKVRDRIYPPGRAGSGFIGFVDLLPMNVSFSRIEVREEATSGTAAGYYDTSLGFDNLPHPRGPWIRGKDDNAAGQDGVGAKPPGLPGPFSWGTFVWNIPQHYRIVGDSGAGTLYATARHTQVMKDATGEETTYKEGAGRTRVP